MVKRESEQPKKTTAESNIKEAFIELYKKKPLHSITVSEIISKAHISRSTFYFYFEDIFDLYAECEKDIISYIEGDLSSIIMSTITKDRDKYKKSVVANFNRISEEKDTLKCFSQGSERAHFLESWFASMCNSFDRTLEFGFATTEEMKELTIRFFAHGQLIVYDDWIQSDGKIDPASIAEILAQMLFDGAFKQKK